MIFCSWCRASVVYFNECNHCKQCIMCHILLCVYLTLMCCVQYCRIAIFGLAFLIATITQLQAAFTRNFHYDMKDDLPRWFMWVLVVTGRAPLQCHFRPILHNKLRTDLYTASCACEGATTMSTLKQLVRLPSCHCSASFRLYLC